MQDNYKILIGTRASQLALWQAEFIRNEILKFYPDFIIELKKISTTGDKIIDTPFSQIPDKSIFTKELENELLAGSIDIAVHSMKDLQTELPHGLKLAAITKRHYVEDALVAKDKNITLADLKKGATIATGSPRRKSQLLNYRNDIKIEDLRGNINTRINKLYDSDWDAIVLARAGLERIGLEKHISSIIPLNIMLPAPGQGALGIEINENNKIIFDILQPLNDFESELAVTAERSFLQALGGGCQTPIAAYCYLEDKNICIEGYVGSNDGKIAYRAKISDNQRKPSELGNKLAELILKDGPLP